MHIMSRATGMAVAHRLEDIGVAITDDLADEVAEFAERARTTLSLDNSALTAAMMFAQPFLESWAPNWKFAYTIGLIIGVKFTTEGFYLADVFDNMTDEFPLEVLKEGERVALREYDWGQMNSRCRSFRNALVHVALQDPVAQLVEPVEDDGAEEVLHVLIVDDCVLTCELHESYVLHHRPSARIKMCSSEESALQYWVQCSEKGDQPQLLLLDLELQRPTTTTGTTGTTGTAFDAIEVEEVARPTLIESVLTAPNGFEVASALDRLDSSEFLPPKDFRFKPLIALVTAHAGQVESEIPVNNDGSVAGCDILLPKPLDVRAVGALIEGSCV